MKITTKILFLLIHSLASLNLFAQSLPVGTPQLQDAYRRAQLLGKFDPMVSFTSLPLFPSEINGNINIFASEDQLKKTNWTSPEKTSLFFDQQKGLLELLPVTVASHFNSNYPYGLNDGIIIPAKGLQTFFSAGFYFKYGPLSLQFKPEFVTAANKNFQGFPAAYRDQIWYEYYEIYNFIDLPERFGTKSYQRASWGQSSVRLNWKALSIGISNENLWWGPGMRNALVLSNNADGFFHYTLNTSRPINTPIGSFEGQIIMGKLVNSGYNPPDTTRKFQNNLLYFPKKDEKRYINAMQLSWQPKWIPGLFLGFTRSFTKYWKEKDESFESLFPIFFPMKRKYEPANNIGYNFADQRTSVYARWLWLPEHTEIYFEYMREDKPHDWRDFFLQMEYSRAYIFGLRKLIPLSASNGSALQINLELTQLEQTNTNASMPYRYLYISRDTKHGYTNNGQMLGPGIGIGSNLQTFGISWVKELKNIGLRAERFVHNNDFHYFVIKDYRQNWVDLVLTGTAGWDWKNLIFSAELSWIKTYNYQHYFEKANPEDDSWWAEGKNVFNFNSQLSVTYQF